MKQAIQLVIHMPFSYYLNRDLDWGNPTLRPTSQLIAAYAHALEAEVESLAPDIQDVKIDSIFFSGGYMSLFGVDQFESLLNTISHKLPLSSHVEISGRLFPGSLDLSLVSSYKSAKVGPLFFEIPSLVAKECENLKLPNTLMALDQTVYVMQSTEFGNFGLQIITGVPGRNENTWNYIAGQIIHYHPDHLEFTSRDTSVKEGPGFRICLDKMSSLGYQEYAPLCFTIADKAPCFHGYRNDSSKEYIGIGLHAESSFDDFWCKNTGDLNFYLTQSTNYRNIIAQVKNLNAEV